MGDIWNIGMTLRPEEAVAMDLHRASCLARGVEPRWRGRNTNRAYYRRLAKAELRRAAKRPVLNQSEGNVTNLDILFLALIAAIIWGAFNG
jgi:hypothetical protein